MSEKKNMKRILTMLKVRRIMGENNLEILIEFLCFDRKERGERVK